MMRQKVQLSGVEAEGVLINNDVRVTYFAGPVLLYITAPIDTARARGGYIIIIIILVVVIIMYKVIGFFDGGGRSWRAAKTN